MDTEISVIIPNYNNDEYLVECLDSVLNQTLKPREIIVADDASTDDSARIIDYYKDKYDVVRGIYREENQGVSKNRDLAIREAKGKYITMLDSDDYYYNKEKLESELNLIRSKQEKEGDVIAYSNKIKINVDTGEVIREMDELKICEGDILFPIITRTCAVPRDFVLPKKQYFKVGGYDSRFPMYEDWDLKIRLAKNCKFYYTGVEGTAHRIHDKGLSQADPKTHFQIMKKVFQKNIHLLSLSLRWLAFFTFYKELSKRKLGDIVQNYPILRSLMHR